MLSASSRKLTRFSSIPVVESPCKEPFQYCRDNRERETNQIKPKREKLECVRRWSLVPWALLLFLSRVFFVGLLLFRIWTVFQPVHEKTLSICFLVDSVYMHNEKKRDQRVKFTCPAEQESLWCFWKGIPCLQELHGLLLPRSPLLLRKFQSFVTSLALSSLTNACDSPSFRGQPYRNSESNLIYKNPQHFKLNPLKWSLEITSSNKQREKQTELRMKRTGNTHNWFLNR